MGCTSCCGTREWRDLPYAHATGHTHTVYLSSAPLQVCVCRKLGICFAVCRNLLVNHGLGAQARQQIPDPQGPRRTVTPSLARGEKPSDFRVHGKADESKRHERAKLLTPAARKHIIKGTDAYMCMLRCNADMHMHMHMHMHMCMCMHMCM